MDGWALTNCVGWDAASGKVLQLVNILKDLPEDIRNGRCYLPMDELRRVGINEPRRTVRNLRRAAPGIRGMEAEGIAVP